MFDDSERPLRESDPGRLILPFPWIVIIEAALAILAACLGWFVGVDPLATLQWNQQGALGGLIGSLPLIGFLWTATRWPIPPIQQMRAFLEAELAPQLEGANWLDLAMLAAAAGIGEEILFRGLIQELIVGKVGTTVGILATSLLFGLFHPVSRFYVLYATLFGVYFGSLWLFTGNLLSVLLAHAVYDFVALIALMSSMQSTNPSR